MNFKYLLFLLCILSSFGCNKEKKTNVAAFKMVEFVDELSSYSKLQNPNFYIIPQNGIELAFNNQNQEDGLNSKYMNAIDAIGIESLFITEETIIDDYRLDQLIEVRSNSKPIFVSDLTENAPYFSHTVTQSKTYNFIPYPRIENNYHYQLIPDSIIDESTEPITNLTAVKNYLYIISTDNYTSKVAFINAIDATNYDMLLIDPYFESELLNIEDITKLKTKPNGSQRIVIAYINIGAAENWRYYWQSDWKKGNPKWLKKKYDGYDDEIWVQYWYDEWKTIIYGNDASYLKKIIDQNFDGAYLDNVEGYYFLYHK